MTQSGNPPTERIIGILGVECGMGVGDVATMANHKQATERHKPEPDVKRDPSGGIGAAGVVGVGVIGR